MSFPCVPDFIVKTRRKRSRRAVDPCLGFYQDTPSSQTVLQSSWCPQPVIVPSCAPRSPSKPAHIPNQNVEQTPKISHCSPVLTVEAFLRSAAASTKRYSRRRRRNLQAGKAGFPTDSEEPDPDLETDVNDPDYRDQQSSPLPRKRRRYQVVWTSDDEYTPDRPIKKRQRRRKKDTRPMATRLLSAAIVTGVDVVGGILCPEGSDSMHTCRRRPLPFVSDNRVPSPVHGHSNAHQLCFVDPRKTSPFDRAVFQFAPTAENTNVLRTELAKSRNTSKPVSSWRPSGDLGMGHLKGFCPASEANNTAVAPRLAITPLRFASVTDDVGTTSCIPRTGGNRKSRTVGVVKRRSMNGRGQITFETSRQSSSRQEATFKPQQKSLFPLSNLRVPPFPGGHSSVTSPLLETVLPSIVDNEEQLPSSSILVSDPPPPKNMASCDAIIPSTTSVSQVVAVPATSAVDGAITLARSVPRKPLRSLGSLLDSFREIARLAMQKSMVSVA